MAQYQCSACGQSLTFTTFEDRTLERCPICGRALTRLPLVVPEQENLPNIHWELESIQSLIAFIDGARLTLWTLTEEAKNVGQGAHTLKVLEKVSQGLYAIKYSLIDKLGVEYGRGFRSDVEDGDNEDTNGTAGGLDISLDEGTSAV